MLKFNRKVRPRTGLLVVGHVLSAFGIFWVGEGIGTNWPGADLSLLPIFGALALFSLVAVKVLRPYHTAHMEPAQ